MELENVNQLREKYPKNADRTDDDIAERYLKMINDKRDKLENLGPGGVVIVSVGEVVSNVKVIL